VNDIKTLVGGSGRRSSAGYGLRCHADCSDTQAMSADGRYGQDTVSDGGGRKKRIVNLSLSDKTRLPWPSVVKNEKEDNTETQ